jgi:serine/threonine protein kinase
VRAPDATTAAGAGLLREAVLRKGEVVGERYQVLEHLAIDAFAGTYRAFDQETEAEVRLRLVHPDLLPDESSRRRLLERLEAALGKGGRYLLPLLDADRDGPRVYVIEPVPAGASLRQVFDERFADGRSFRPVEVLPIVARLAAGLDALPTGFRHGDIRPARIWAHGDELSLGGGYLASALPEGAVAAALQSDAHRAQHAPELAHGGPSPTTDLYGVALVALEALIGALPESPSQAIPASLGGVGDALAGLLVANPAERGQSLSVLLGALSRQADAPVPVLDVGVYRDGRARSIRPLPGEPTDPSVFFTPTAGPSSPAAADAELDDEADVPTLPPPAAERGADAARPIQSDEVDRETTRRVAYPWVAESAALGDAAATPRLPDREARSSSDDVPTARREARPRAIEGAARDGTQEITLDQIVEERERRAALAADPAPPVTPISVDALGFEVAEPTEPTRPRVVADDLIDTLPRRGRAVRPLPRRAAAPDLEGVKPIPRPRRIESILPPPPAHGPNVVLFDDSRPDAPAPESAPRAAEQASPRPHATEAREEGVTITERPPPMPPRAAIGRWIVLVSLLAAVGIIAGSLAFASYRRARADQERELRLRERYEELRRENADGPERTAGAPSGDGAALRARAR